jgi:hypothetical protein
VSAITDRRYSQGQPLLDGKLTASARASIMECAGNQVFVSKLGDLLQSWWRSAERLFQALVGLVFLFFTLAGASVSYEEWKSFEHSASASMVRLSLLVGFTVLLFFCALYSFLKSRSIK